SNRDHHYLPSFPTRRSSDLAAGVCVGGRDLGNCHQRDVVLVTNRAAEFQKLNRSGDLDSRGEDHVAGEGRNPEVIRRNWFSGLSDRKSTRLNSSHSQTSYAV